MIIVETTKLKRNERQCEEITREDGAWLGEDRVITSSRLPWGALMQLLYSGRKKEYMYKA
jgi:hypothetical protein